MLPTNLRIVSPAQFDKIFSEEALIAEFASPADEDAYVDRDSFLIYLLKREVQRHFGTDESRTPHILEDWWPNHTRYLDVTPEHCTTEFLTAVRGLLTDEYSDYRVQICVYDDMLCGDTCVGAMSLHSDRAVIEQRLYERLRP